MGTSLTSHLQFIVLKHGLVRGSLPYMWLAPVAIDCGEKIGREAADRKRLREKEAGD